MLTGCSSVVTSIERSGGGSLQPAGRLIVLCSASCQHACPRSGVGTALVLPSSCSDSSKFCLSDIRPIKPSQAMWCGGGGARAPVSGAGRGQ